MLNCKRHFQRRNKKIITLAAITERINEFGANKRTFFKRKPGTGRINLLGANELDKNA